MKLSIIIAYLNDPDEIRATVQSIRDTAGFDPEILVVDDYSPRPLASVLTNAEELGVRIIRNHYRMGCGYSRSFGSEHATGQMLLFTDPHMRFPQHWYGQAMERIADRPKTLHCATCVALDKHNMDLSRSRSDYQGATINIVGVDRNDATKSSVMEAVWNPAEPVIPDDAHIAACMGAAYFIPRDWFQHIDPLTNLKSWGSDELMLSMKTWMAGGEVRLLKNVRIGHRFTLKDEPPKFTAPKGHPTYNKLFAAHSLLPSGLSKIVTNHLQWSTAADEFAAAMVLFNMNRGVVLREAVKNGYIFGGVERAFRDYAERFHLSFPSY